jgi:hypothetical protein
MRWKTLRWLIPLTLLIGAAASCGGWFFWPGGGIPPETRDVLDQADEWELYSLFPDEREKSLPARFQGWPVLGKTTVRDAETRRRLRQALAEGTKRYQQWFPAAACFVPRHGIHASHGGKSVDLVICFQCGHVQGNGANGFRTTAAPQPAFDAVLADAGVPLAPSGPPPWELPSALKGSENGPEESHRGQ